MINEKTKAQAELLGSVLSIDYDTFVQVAVAYKVDEYTAELNEREIVESFLGVNKGFTIQQRWDELMEAFKNCEIEGDELVGRLNTLRPYLLREQEDTRTIAEKVADHKEGQCS